MLSKGAIFLSIHALTVIPSIFVTIDSFGIVFVQLSLITKFLPSYSMRNSGHSWILPKGYLLSKSPQ